MLKSASSSVAAVLLSSGAHHLDLFFSNPLDPPDVLLARRIERDHITTWIQQVKERFESQSTFVVPDVLIS